MTNPEREHIAIVRSVLECRLNDMANNSETIKSHYRWSRTHSEINQGGCWIPEKQNCRILLANRIPQLFGVQVELTIDLSITPFDFSKKTGVIR